MKKKTVIDFFIVWSIIFVVSPVILIFIMTEPIGITIVSVVSAFIIAFVVVKVGKNKTCRAEPLQTIQEKLNK